MKESNFNHLDNFIAGWYIDEDICNKVIEYHATQKQDKGKFYTLDGDVLIDETIKKSIDVGLEPNNEVFDLYVQALVKCVDKYVEKYPYSNNFQQFGLVEGINIQKYEPNGGYFPFHCERGGSAMPAASRHLVYITYLNDVTDGGQTEFFHQKMKIKPKKGLTVIFPADWTFTHRGIPSPTQEKIIVTGWLNFL